VDLANQDSVPISEARILQNAASLSTTFWRFYRSFSTTYNSSPNQLRFGPAL